MKNKIIVVITILSVLIIVLTLVIIIYNNSASKIGLQVKDSIKQNLEIEVFKEDIKVGKALGGISSWKYNNSYATSSLLNAKKVLEKEIFLENVNAGDLVKLSMKNFENLLLENIFEITYNAMDDEENIILPVDETLDIKSQFIEVPILRENSNKILYYYVTVKIQNKGTIIYFFKVNP